MKPHLSRYENNPYNFFVPSSVSRPLLFKHDLFERRGDNGRRGKSPGIRKRFSV